jgi:hypothetical protein
LELCFDEFVAIEIDEGNLAMPELIGETGFINKELRVTMVTRSFGHHDRCSPKAQKGVCRTTDELSIGVHGSSRNVFDDVGLE